MRFILYSAVAFEPWNWMNSIEQGIGGSETSHVEMAWRLAKRGHEVISYVPLPEGSPNEWRGTQWYHVDQVDWSLPGVWVLYRDPALADHFLDQSPATHRLWALLQDWDYATWTPERIARHERIVPLCRSHADWLTARHREPGFGERIWITSNGLKPELIAEAESEGPVERNPRRIMYASSPDRGLLPLLKSFRRAVEMVPDLELHAFYGFNNLDKLIARQGPSSGFAKQKAQMLRLAEHPNITLHGRVPQTQLYREWLKTGLWVYQTNFWETSCITCMEAQALGAVPIYNPVWALGENVHHGLMIRGNATDDPLVAARFSYGIWRLATDPALQERIRQPMMADARLRFSWENFVDQWERCAADPRAEMPA